MSIALTILLVVLTSQLAYLLSTVLKRQRKTVEEAINEMDDTPFLISTVITVEYTKDDVSATSELITTKPYTGPGTLIATPKELRDVCLLKDLVTHPFVDQILNSGLVSVSFKDISEAQNIYTKVPPNSYLYSFSRGPDWEESQAHMPPYLYSLSSHIGGEFNSWIAAGDISNQLSYTVSFLSLDQAELVSFSFSLSAIDTSKVEKTVQDFELISVNPDFLKKK